MNKALLKELLELLELPAAERLEIVEELWDSLAPEEFPPLSDEQKAEIDRRLEAHEKDPGRASPWEEVQARLWARYR
jgi:putative addiction module component (TIGR02574 family)